MIKRAFTYARQSTYDGPQLDLKRYGASVWWQGKGGLGIRQLVGFIKLLLSVEESPDIIVVHCGGNDIGSIPALQLRILIIDTLDLIKQLIPGVLLVWSQILPRLEWRGEVCHKALNKVRERVNNKVATDVIAKGGRYIRYPELDQNISLFVDKVHLSDMGNNFFLHSLQAGLQQFLSTENVASPIF